MLKAFELTLGVLLILGSLWVDIYTLLELLEHFIASKPLRLGLLSLLRFALFASGMFLIIVSPCA